MEVKERIAYVRGLIEGAESFQPDPTSRAVWENLLIVCDESGRERSGARNSPKSELEEYVEGIDTDLYDLEEEVYGEEYAADGGRARRRRGRGRKSRKSLCGPSVPGAAKRSTLKRGFSTTMTSRSRALSAVKSSTGATRTDTSSSTTRKRAWPPSPTTRSNLTK